MRMNVALLTALAVLAVNIPSAAAQSDLQNVMSQYDAKIYGRVKFDVMYDTDQFDRFGDALSTVTAAEKYDNSSTNFNPRDSRIGIAAVRNEPDWTSEARIESDFYGSVSGSTFGPRLRLGYVKLTHKSSDTAITIGQDWQPIAQLNPPMIDFGILAGGGNLWLRAPQITVRKKVGENLEALFSVLHYRRDSTADKDLEPWLMGRLAYTTKEIHAALGAGWRTEDVDDAAGNEETVNRWVAVAELKVAAGPVTIILEPWVGQGHDGFVRTGHGINTASGTPEEIFSWGGFAALSANPTNEVSVSLGYGIDNPDDDDLEGLELNDARFLKNQRAFVNSWYSLNKAVKVGMELNYLKTDREDSRDGFRILGSTIMSF